MKYNVVKDSGLDSDFRFEKLAQIKNGSIKNWDRSPAKPQNYEIERVFCSATAI